VTVIDITHQIPAHDVRAGSLALWRAAPWLVPGVILAVVDPGVGSARRAVAVEVGAAAAVLVGPDNGILLPAIISLGPITGAVELAGPTSGAADGRGVTFAGRDILARASAELAKGVELHRLGSAIDAEGLVGTPLPRAEADPDGRLRTEVLWVDHFGNAQLNACPADVAHLGPVVEVRVARGSWPARLVGTYAAIDRAAVGLVTDSYGLLAISGNGASAAALTGLRSGDEVWLGRWSGE